MKIVHYIWYQGKYKIPNEYIKNIKKTKDSLAGWEIKIWDNDSIIELLRDDDYLLDKYLNLRMLHQKVDFARYCILYFYGGLYVDMDAYIIKSPEFLRMDNPGYNVFISKLNWYWYELLLMSLSLEIYNNGVIYVTDKRTDFMRNLIRGVDYNKRGITKEYEISNTTGPSFFTKVAKDSSGVKILSHEVLEPCIIHSCDKTSKTVAVHNHKRSWINKRLNVLVDLYGMIRTPLVPIIPLLIIYLIFRNLV